MDKSPLYEDAERGAIVKNTKKLRWEQKRAFQLKGARMGKKRNAFGKRMTAERERFRAKNSLPAWTPFERVFADDEALRELHDTEGEMVLRNSRYLVSVTRVSAEGFAINGKEVDGFAHLSIKRHDKEPIGDWREMLRIKNEICGEESEGVELFPAMSRCVDSVNQFHLWVLNPDGETPLFPFGFNNRFVEDADSFTAEDRERWADTFSEHPDPMLKIMAEQFRNHEYGGGAGHPEQRKVPAWMKPGISDYREFVENHGNSDDDLFMFLSESSRDRFIGAVKEKCEGNGWPVPEYATTEDGGKFYARFNMEELSNERVTSD